MNEKITILLVDDEAGILEFLRYNLEKEGYNVVAANNGIDAIRLAEQELPCLIVLDLMMPGMDGIETCMELRKLPVLKDTLIVFLTARNEDYSQVAALEAGADDYIPKPIKPRVFVSKLKSLLRRAQPSLPELFTVAAGITIDKERYVVFKGKKELSLPKKEFELLFLLMSRPGKAFTRDEILNTVWGDEVIVGDRTIDVHVRKLREKLGDDLIKTIKGVGYKLESSL